MSTVQVAVLVCAGIVGMFVIIFFTSKALARLHSRDLQDNLFEQLFERIPDTVLLLDSKGTVKKTNPEGFRWFAAHHMEPSQYVDLLDDQMKAQLLTGIPHQHDEMQVALGTKRRSLAIYIDYIPFSGEQCTLLMLRDNTKQKQKEEKLEYLAYYDSLTGLPNRQLFIEKLEAAIKQAPRHQEAIMVMLIHLDRLTLLNHTHGHVSGNTILQQMAQTLISITANNGMAARMSGDEFILYRSVSPSKLEAQTDLQSIQDELARCLTGLRFNPIDIHIGTSYYPSDGADAQALINIADSDMIDKRRAKA